MTDFRLHFLRNFSQKAKTSSDLGLAFLENNCSYWQTGICLNKKCKSKQKDLVKRYTDFLLLSEVSHTSPLREYSGRQRPGRNAEAGLHPTGEWNGELPGWFASSTAHLYPAHRGAGCRLQSGKRSHSRNGTRENQHEWRWLTPVEPKTPSLNNGLGRFGYPKIKVRQLEGTGMGPV